MRLITDLTDIPATAWDALVRASHQGVLHPALRHAYLHALQTSGSACADTGWGPCHLALQDAEGRWVAAAPLYLKSHSYGEYVFDWAWADAYHRNKLAYYPKLLCAIPFTPVFGERLLAADEPSRAALAQALLDVAKVASEDESLLGCRISSLHGLFFSEISAGNLLQSGLLRRDALQFHWRNQSADPQGQAYPDFDAFVTTLTRKRRKNIAAERRKVAEAGFVVKPVEGGEMNAEQTAFVYRCYANTYHEHQSTPYLTPAFFSTVLQTMPEAIVVFIAYRGAESVACSVCLKSETHLYGRYWGAVEQHPCLHFECAYYAPLTYAIEQGLRVFEGGAQGEHKMSRGFLPVAARSVHWLAHPGFADAIDRYLQRESAGVAAWQQELEAHSPFMTPPGAAE